jgi:hypothetical protein
VTDLHTQIRQLDRAIAYEAAQMLAAELGADPDANPIDHEVITKPERHPDDLEDLAKVLLLITADIAPDTVTSAIDGAGNKQLILSGSELIALAVLVIGGLQVIISRGKASERVEIVYERDSNGEIQVVRIDKTTRYRDISNPVASILRGLLQGNPQDLQKSVEGQ